MLAIDRKRGDFHKQTYTCCHCNATAEAVAALDHADNCAVNVPDDVDLPFPDSTQHCLKSLCWRAFDACREGDTLEDITERFADADGVQWLTKGSSARFVIGLGRTSPRGDFHLDDQRGIVLKIDPYVRTNTDTTPGSGNIAELQTWQKARETETDHLFGEILGAATDGAWLVMEACIPIQSSVFGEMSHRDILYDAKGREYISPLVEELREHGWVDIDSKHGNVGLTDDNRTVLIDYGTGPRYEPETV